VLRCQFLFHRTSRRQATVTRHREDIVLRHQDMDLLILLMAFRQDIRSMGLPMAMARTMHMHHLVIHLILEGIHLDIKEEPFTDMRLLLKGWVVVDRDLLEDILCRKGEVIGPRLLLSSEQKATVCHDLLGLVPLRSATVQRLDERQRQALISLLNRSCHHLLRHIKIHNMPHYR
jgi:hypothetical protein